MVVILSFDEDPASINIRDRLIKMGDYKEIGKLEGYPVYDFNDFILATLKGDHLYRTDLDNIFSKLNIKGYRALIILSRHSAKSGIPTLTVHPTGNYGEALYGGLSGKLSLSEPLMMRELLRRIKIYKEKFDLNYRVSYEVTHHGPLILNPHIFVEIGSVKENWSEGPPAEAISKSLLEVLRGDFKPPKEVKIAVGVGGGHYTPRFTDIALKKDIAFGHMLPDYAMEEAIKNPKVIEQMIEKTPGVEYFFVHKTKKSGDFIERVVQMLTDEGLRKL